MTPFLCGSGFWRRLSLGTDILPLLDVISEGLTERQLKSEAPGGHLREGPGAVSPNTQGSLTQAMDIAGFHSP